MEFKEIEVPVPDHDCDVVLRFASGKQVTIQCRPSNADVGYNGSLDVILPTDRPVTCWEGEDMKPARQVGNQPETRLAQQLVTELP